MDKESSASDIDEEPDELDEFLTQGPLVPIVDVKVTSDDGDKHSSASADDTASTARSDQSQSNGDSEDVLDEDCEDEEDSDDSASTDTKSGGKKKKERRLDINPPDQKLTQAERKARKYSKKKQTSKAMREYIRCTVLSRIVYGDGHWKLARAYVNLACAYLDLNGYAAQCEEHCNYARAMLVKNVQLSASSDDRDQILVVLLNLHYSLGRSQALLKKYPEAEQSFLSAEKIIRERSLASDVSESEIRDCYIKVYLALAKSMARQKKKASSTSYYEKALALMERKYSSGSEDLVPIYQALGRVEQSQADVTNHEKAIGYFVKAHSIASEHHKPESTIVADTAMDLGLAYASVGQIDAEVSAESYFNECLAIYKSTLGPSHSKTLRVQDELAKLMIRTDRNSEAIELIKKTLPTKEETFGEYSHEVADAYKLLGNIHLCLGEHNKALKDFKKCQDIEILLHGPKHRKVQNTQKSIDLVSANVPNKDKPGDLKGRPRFSAIVKN